MTIRALIFDLDGVIAQTLHLHYLAWQRLSNEEDIPFSPRDYDRMLGLSRRQAFDVFINGHTVSAATAETWMDRKNGYFLKLLEDLTPQDRKPGAAELIAEARAAGLRIGLGSSSQNARRVLEKLELLTAFDVIGDGNTVARLKPAPDVFLWTAQRLGVMPGEAVVFEDSDAGVQAGREGGFWVVGIGAERVARAHVVVPTLAGLRLADLLTRFPADSA